MIRPFRHIWCQKVLPLVYDESLSYYEVLCKVLYKLNELIDRVNTIIDYQAQIDGLADDIQKLNDIIAKINVTLKLLGDQANKSTDDISVLQQNYKDLSTLFHDLRSFVDTLVPYIDARDDELRKLIAQSTADLRREFSSYYGETLAEIDKLWKAFNAYGLNGVYNYVLCKRVGLDRNNDEIYADLENAIPAQEYCELGLTADEYAKYEVSARGYIQESKKRLHYDYVYMPVSGNKQEISNAITETYNRIGKCLTADQYAELGYTADAYADLKWTSDYYRYHNLEDTIADLEKADGRITALESDNVSNKNSISVLQTDVENLTHDVADNSTNISTNSADITTLKTSVQKNTDDIANLKSGETVEGLTARIADVETKANTNEGNITTLQTDVSGIKSTVGNTESGLVKAVHDNSTSIATIKDSADTNASNIATLQNSYSVLTTSVNDVASLTNDNSTNITAIQSTLTTQDKSIKANSDAITVLQGMTPYDVKVINYAVQPGTDSWNSVLPAVAKSFRDVYTKISSSMKPYFVLKSNQYVVVLDYVLTINNNAYFIAETGNKALIPIYITGNVAISRSSLFGFQLGIKDTSYSLLNDKEMYSASLDTTCAYDTISFYYMEEPDSDS